MEENILKDLILEVANTSKENNCYSLLINEDIWNNELFVLYTKNKPGLANYYPDKKEKILLDNKSIKEIIDKLREMDLTYNDVLFIDSIKEEDYVLLNLYIKEFTTLSSIVKNSGDNSKMTKLLKNAAASILEKIENSNGNEKIIIDKYTRLLLLANSIKDEEEILNKASQKNIEIVYQ